MPPNYHSNETTKIAEHTGEYNMATSTGVAVDEEPHSTTVGDSIITEYATYEDFLDSQITQTDLYYLEVFFLNKAHLALRFCTFL